MGSRVLTRISFSKLPSNRTSADQVYDVSHAMPADVDGDRRKIPFLSVTRHNVLMQLFTTACCDYATFLYNGITPKLL
jgi:hypothetical protein